MRPKLSKTLSVPVPSSWDDALNEIAQREFKGLNTVTREMILAGLRSRGIDPFNRANAPPEAA